MPFVLMDNSVCMSRELVDTILQSRSQGVSFDLICKNRNESTAKR
jgi:hypothetical protein